MTEAPATNRIPDQLTLPLSVAFEVVVQGLRIRFGRSLVTVTGVVFGIAFLMSIFSGLALKTGIGSEQRARVETDRMLSFLVAEAGQPTGHAMGLVTEGELGAQEIRLLQKLDGSGLDELRVAAPRAVLLPPLSKTKIRTVPLDAVGEGTSAVLWTGEKAPPGGWEGIFQKARQSVLVLTRPAEIAAPPEGIHVVRLASAPTEEAQARAAQDQKKTRFRNIWIITISLLVTIIGISNAMLMSVTERFREIGTMKCLGALSAFVRRMFLIESGFIGVVGGIAGCIVGLFFSLLAYSLTYGTKLVFLSLWHGLGPILVYSVCSVAAGLLLAVIAALYPASVASNMVPATALRSNV